MAHSKKLVTWEVSDTMPVKGTRGGSRGTIAQTTSYRKSKESAQSTTANIEETEIDDLLEASLTYASDVVSLERQVHKSQFNLVETSSSESTEKMGRNA
ncbi:hypothetical protein Syun_025954 [Stephania yunnanensis]|uniref:Uncharacterized protein n=1 Tax=Stephania yunnanensis TaxID=152371 RepID=A0AAP0HVS5_9MAGN